MMRGVWEVGIGGGAFDHQARFATVDLDGDGVTDGATSPLEATLAQIEGRPPRLVYAATRTHDLRPWFLLLFTAGAAYVVAKRARK